MKKNRMMRLASVLLVLTLLTTSMISGTFAKYVTQNGGSDKAQVAKFGVTISVDDDMGLFDSKYDVGESSITVKSNSTATDNSENRVAPGTKGEMSFSITGTPEVATKVTVEASGTAIQLSAGTYTLDKGKFSNAETKVTTAAVYEPIKFYFGEEAITDNTEYDKTLDDLVNALTTTTNNEPNVTLDKTYYIGWQWAFQNSVAGSFVDAEPYEDAQVVDFLDTYLGDEENPRNETLTLSIKVEQVD